jgi:hypothetical protein
MISLTHAVVPSVREHDSGYALTATPMAARPCCHIVSQLDERAPGGLTGGGSGSGRR